MSTVTDARLGAAIAAMPAWEGAQISVVPIEAGITNRNYQVTVDGVPFFVRMAGDDTEHLGIDRHNECVAAEAAAALGVGPPVVAFLPEHRCLVTEFLPGEAIPPEQLREPATLGALVASLKLLHTGAHPPSSFSPFEVVTSYRVAAAERGVQVPSVYWDLLERAEAVQRAFEVAPTPLAACHNDLLNANFLRWDDRVLLVDYEYAGCGDPFFDLGNLSVNNDLDAAADELLLSLYFGEVTPARHARLSLMRFMSDFREAMWGVLQQALSTLDFDYVEYAQTHFTRCQTTAEQPDFGAWLEAAEGPVV
jgi:thiamine kinase-like enzyme